MPALRIKCLSPEKWRSFSQSGAICTAILDLSIKENIGFSYFVSLGDMLDVDFGDMINYLGGEADIGSIVMLQQIPSRLPRRPDFDRLNLFRPKVCIDDFSHP